MYDEKLVIGKNNTGFTIISNIPIQKLNDFEAIGLYTYLRSLPEGWNFYKTKLQEYGNIGRDKLQSILKKLESHNLITLVQIRNARGKFSHLCIDFNEVDSFKFNDIEQKAPMTEKPLTANQSLVNRSYKRNINKKTYKKEILKSFSASRDARVTPKSFFDDFYKIYPKKRNPSRAREVWERKKYDEIASLIIADVNNRLMNDSQWKDEQFIPHPSTYLQNRRWEDEITLSKIPPRSETPMQRSIRMNSN